MTFLPIVERELRVASRRRGTYWARLIAAIIGLLFASWIMVVNSHQPPQALGQEMFVAIAILTFIYAIAAGAWTTADCLSEEKREGTLGLLFLTDLKGYDVVLGKLAATSLNAFYGMLAIFPVLAIPLLLGGVTVGEFWRVVFVSISLLFFSLTAGLFISSMAREERKAMSGTTLLLLLTLGLAPGIGLYIVIKHQANTFPMEFLWPSPAFACWTAFDIYFRAFPNYFWMTLAVIHSYALIFLFCACRIAPHSWQDKPTGAKRSRWLNRLQLLAEGNSDARKAVRQKLLESNPVLWLAGRGRFKQILVWIFLGTCIALWWWICVFVMSEIKWWENPFNVAFCIILQVVLKSWLASEGCRRFGEDRRSGALELLLSTPLSVPEILRGQRLALFRQFAKPAAVVLIIDFILMMTGVTHMNNSEEQIVWLLFGLLNMIFLVLDLLSLSWVSMWMGLSSRKANRAAGGAVTRILFLPTLIFCLSMTCFGFFGRMFFHGWAMPLFYWAFLCGVTNAAFSLQAKENLRRNFREMATQHTIGESPRPQIKFAPASVPPVLATR